MVHGIQSRRATFIASKEWIDVPFSGSRPSIMQQLIDISAILPSLLEQADQLVGLSYVLLTTKLPGLWESFLGLLSKLKSWEKALDAQSMWSQSSHSDLRSSNLGPNLWFTDITMANFYTHIWAFQIICILELHRLADLQDATSWNLPESSSDIHSMSQKICLSMKYLLQDGMRLFGPASALLPLQTAYKVYNEDRHRYTRELRYIERTVDCLVEKGLRSSPYTIYG